jgi:hypothetical protein
MKIHRPMTPLRRRMLEDMQREEISIAGSAECREHLVLLCLGYIQ